MAADNTAEIARLRAGIADMLKKVPPSIASAGLNATRAYTEAAKKAKKVLTNTRSTLASAQASYTAMASFWKS